MTCRTATIASPCDAAMPFLDAAGRASARELPRLRPTDRRAAARPTAECPEQYSGQSRLHASDRPDRRRGGAYPEAREAVIAALRDLDAGSASGPALPDH